jgi:AcrR family transcriptional regulator
VTRRPGTATDRPTPVRSSGNGEGCPKPLRRDAEVNLARILVAAADVFAEDGYEASMEQIADRAGLGVGTLYRRFPSKSDLVGAVVLAATNRTREIAEAVLAESSPAEGVFDFLRRCVATPSCWRMIASKAPGIGEIPRSGVFRIAPVVEELLDRARRVDAIRGDVVFSDLAVALMSVRAVADLFDPHHPATSARYLELVMDGLRPNGQRWANPAMTTGELGSVLLGR